LNGAYLVMLAGSRAQAGKGHSAVFKTTRFNYSRIPPRTANSILSLVTCSLAAAQRACFAGLFGIGLSI
jgi:hypothetical protein